MNKEDVAHIYNGIRLSHKKEWNNAICSNKDGPRDYCTKWRQARQISLYVESNIDMWVKTLTSVVWVTAAAWLWESGPCFWKKKPVIYTLWYSGRFTHCHKRDLKYSMGSEENLGAPNSACLLLKGMVGWRENIWHGLWKITRISLWKMGGKLRKESSPRESA